MLGLEDRSLNYLIELKNISISDRKKVIIENLNFSLAQSEFVYLTGRSGSGKSTIIKALYGAAKVAGEKATVLDEDLFRLTKSKTPEFRRKMGIIYQDMHLFQEWTSFENLFFVLKATGWKDKVEMKLRCHQVLEAVKIDDLENQYVYDLSAGQKQKLAFARSIINNPKLILADEPTANLDSESSEELLDLMHEISSIRRTAILFATHDKEIMEKYPARVMHCSSNQLTDTGLVM